MRVVHFFLGIGDPHRPDGIERWVYHVTRCQAQHGATVAVFGLENHAPAAIPGVDARTYPRLRFPFALPRSLRRDLIRWRPDVIHVHSVYTPALTSLAKWAQFRRIPYVISAHGGLSSATGLINRARKLAYRRLFQIPDMNRALFVHAVSPREPLREYGVRAPVVVAPNGFAPDEMPAEPDRELLRRRLPALHGRRVFLFLGRLSMVHKGLDLLIQAFAQARPENSALVIVGPDYQGYQATLETMIQDLGLGADVFLLGPAQGAERFHLLAGADVFVHPSRWEGSSLSVLEAAASGRPSLLTVAADMNTGLLAQHGGAIDVTPDADDIAGALRTFAIMPTDDLVRMGRNAAEVVTSRFGWDKTAAALIEGYRRYLPFHGERSTILHRAEARG
ncbi:MAG: glycosyltransferase family 4 protein [Anaerolineae bacterium]|nr:glycosyltransferase family 4 protein [Anaerolineae bacterium]